MRKSPDYEEATPKEANHQMTRSKVNTCSYTFDSHSQADDVVQPTDTLSRDPCWRQRAGYSRSECTWRAHQSAPCSQSQDETTPPYRYDTVLAEEETASDTFYTRSDRLPRHGDCPAQKRRTKSSLSVGGGAADTAPSPHCRTCSESTSYFYHGDNDCWYNSLSSSLGHFAVVNILLAAAMNNQTFQDAAARYYQFRCAAQSCLLCWYTVSCREWRGALCYARCCLLPCVENCCHVLSAYPCRETAHPEREAQQLCEGSRQTDICRRSW